MIADFRAQVTRARHRLSPHLLLPLAQAAVGLAAAWAALRLAPAGVGGRLYALGWAVGLPLLLHLGPLAAGFLRAAASSPLPAASWWRAGLAELPNTLRVYYHLLPFRAGFEPPAPAREPRPGSPIPLPMLFLHGYGANRGLWWPAARWFAARGHAVAAIDLLPRLGGIDDYGPRIDDALDTLERQKPGRPVVIVAHSMGGLAVRAWLASAGAERRRQRVAAVITLGTPFHGTHVAGLALGRNGAQMRTGSRWLADLEQRVPAVPAGLPVTVLQSLNDNIVDQPSAQIWPGARTIRLRHIGHMRLATSPRIFRLIARLAERAAHS